MSASGLSRQQRSLLEAVAAFYPAGAPTGWNRFGATDLARSLGRDARAGAVAPSVSRTVRRLEQRGLVRRCGSGMFELTAAGVLFVNDLRAGLGLPPLPLVEDRPKRSFEEISESLASMGMVKPLEQAKRAVRQLDREERVALLQWLTDALNHNG